jgi:YHS domain-containing protein
MSAAGLATEAIMRAAGGVPSQRPRLIAAQHFAWDHTTVLNIAAVIGFVLVVRAARRPSAGSSASYAIDPVCGMQVERTQAPASYGEGGTRVYFCSERCHDKYLEKVS